MSLIANAMICSENQNASRLEPRGAELKPICADAHGETGTTAIPPFIEWHPAGQAGGLPMSHGDDVRPDSRTPSGWHDDAIGRDGGHDDMQMRWWRWLRARTEPREWTDDHGTIRKIVPVGTWVEFPFTSRRDGRLIGFADVAHRFNAVELDYPTAPRKSYWDFYEIKPRVYSIGALVRQCEALKIIADRAGFSGRYSVGAVVYDDDPKLKLLKELEDIWVIPLPRESTEDRP